MATPDAGKTFAQLHAAVLMHKQLRGAALASHEEKLLREQRGLNARQAAMQPPRTGS